ncbi:MAG: tRNA (N6-threonylcarbamoyladenosine(37)-N6)-methyltransferase TrmO [Deltaproteobacteria bacterium]|nr:tRNA (N6-threonylcarbamoyladenosine(37)-N6)-methyltransferase TrmO [Deltaproteobacteria bacterium]
MRLLSYFLLLAFGGTVSVTSVGVPSREFTVHSIGWVKKAQGKTTIVLDKKYQPGLQGLDGFSHVYVLYWFDRNDNPEKRSVLQVHPRGNKQNPLTGVFATRSPARPNLIALSLCKIIEIKDNVIEIENIDALPDTPVLDLKPFISQFESKNAVVPEWLRSGTKKR